MKIINLLLAMALTLSLFGCAHEHAYTETEVAPTCTQDGYTIYSCACGDTYKNTKKASGHIEKTVEEKEATCLESGLTEGKECAVCGEMIQEQTVIPPKGHQYGDWVVILESTLNETGKKAKTCVRCGDQITDDIPKKEDALAEQYTVTYDLNGGHFVGGYTSTAQIAEDFLADFNQYGDGSLVTKENFQTESHPCVKTSLSNPVMLQKWNWLWVYMLSHLQQENKGVSSSYINDTYPVLQKMIHGDTEAILESANARTSIRSYIHGLLNSMKGCGEINVDFSVYSPDFSSKTEQENLLKNQYHLEATLDSGASLPTPVREGYRFEGWKNKYEEMISEANCNGALVAIWHEENPVQKVEIVNKVAEIGLYENYQLQWLLSPSNAGNRNVKFLSDHEEIATIDENGKITAHQVGEVTFEVRSLSEHGYSDTMTVKILTPGYFDIRYETNSYVSIGEKIKLHAVYFDRNHATCPVSWSSLDESIATVDDTGCVTGVTAGIANIRVSTKQGEAYQDFVVTVLPQELSDGVQLALRAHESNIFVRHDLPIGAGKPAYYSDIFGGVSRLLYDQALEIDYTYNQRTNDKYGSSLESRRMSSIEFITVHYTAGFSAGADGNAHGEWFSQPLSDNNTSIHYSTGNDGVFKGLDEEYRAAHAGDDGAKNTVAQFSWIDTPLEVLETDPEFPVVTITPDATFAINGRDTGVRVPKETKYNRGYVTDSKWLNEQGIGVTVKDGRYQIGTCWWCYTQVGEGRICSNGGNRNSIGIESAVNQGSDLWYTWQITAQLVADIMERQQLDITRVKGHHFFSAKACPQPMLENDLEIWWEFIELVRAEHERITVCKDYDFTFQCESELVNEHGRVLGQKNTAQVITYDVTVTGNGESQTITLASILEGTYQK